MKKEKIPYKEIQRIAQEVTQSYSPRELPSLEEVSWAFPVDGQEKVFYERQGFIDRIPNIQEGNTMKQLMTYKNFHNVLTFLSKGKIIRGAIPNHAFPCGDTEDGAYIVYPYIKQRNSGLGKGEPNEGFFWETMPNKLVTAILKVERTGRGKIVDDNGEEIDGVGNSAYIDTDLTRQYLQNLREASEMGKEHFYHILQSRNQAGNYFQLVLDKETESWKVGDEFQWGFYSDGQPRLCKGKVLENNGKEIKFEADEKTNIVSQEIETLNKYGEHGLLWKLIPVGGKR